MTPGGLTPNAWTALRRVTAARIALGRAGGSLPTSEVLRFALDHAEARDAVHAEIDFEEIERSLAALPLSSLRVDTAASDRVTYLRRPDLGRRLADTSRERLRAVAGDDARRHDLAIIVADGLSGRAASLYAPRVLSELVPALERDGKRVAPVALARFARVAVQDEVATELRAAASLILLGERPGLHAPVSLGAYFVYAPRVGTTDERRNCVSNIREGGLSPVAAAATLLYLVAEAFRRGISGVDLKDERRHAGLIDPPTPDPFPARR